MVVGKGPLITKARFQGVSSWGRLALMESAPEGWRCQPSARPA